MVGVPGRSKACHTCRRRRISCGGELPTCRNCARSNRACTGYHRQHAFILSPAMARPLPGCDAGSGAVMVSRWRAEQNRPSGPSSKDRASMAGMLATAVALPQHVSARNVFRDSFFSLMVESDLPSGSGLYRTFGDRYDWPMHILHLPSLAPALENALLAICTARLGRHAARPALVQQSLELYTKGVAQARRDILDRSMRGSEQSLAACLSLLLYEAIECPAGTMDGYQAHYRGCLELLQMRGARAHASGLAHATLQILRLHTVVLGNQQRSSFLAQPEWLDLPWSSRPDAKSPFDRLVDILLSMPDSSAQGQAKAGATDPRRALGDAWTAMEEGRRSKDELQRWFQGFQAALPGSLYHAELSKIDTVVDSAESGKLFPVAFRFPTFMVGQTLVYYWVALMSVQTRLCLTYATLARLVATLDSMGRANLPCTCGQTAEGPARCLRHFTLDLLPGADRRDGWPRAAAYNVCQSAEYFLQDTTRGFGPASALPALAWVKGLWKQAPGCWDREIAWIDDMVGRIHASGYGIAGAVLGQNPALRNPV